MQENYLDYQSLLMKFKRLEVYQINLLLMKIKIKLYFVLQKELLTRLGFLGYWFFDNLLILSKLQVIKKSPKQFTKPSMSCWFIANLASILHSLYTIRDINKQIYNASQFLKDASEENQGKFQAMIKKLRQKKTVSQKNLIKSFGDLVTSGQGAGIWNLFGLSFNDGTIGICGMVSSYIASEACFQKC